MHRLPHFDLHWEATSSRFRPEDADYQQVTRAPGRGVRLRVTALAPETWKPPIPFLLEFPSGPLMPSSRVPQIVSSPPMLPDSLLGPHGASFGLMSRFPSGAGAAWRFSPAEPPTHGPQNRTQAWALSFPLASVGNPVTGCWWVSTLSGRQPSVAGNDPLFCGQAVGCTCCLMWLWDTRLCQAVGGRCSEVGLSLKTRKGRLKDSGGPLGSLSFPVEPYVWHHAKSGCHPSP